MNCPGHILIYNKGVRSYRDLPLRYGEFGACHRNEPSGALHGLMRVRGFVQDDGHIFCTEEHVLPECLAFTELLQKVYRDFGFTEIIYKVATRPKNRIGSDEAWDKAEKALVQALEKSGLKFTLSPGEGAFYGPKIEYSLKDGIGRVWQCGTMQVDFSMPGRLGAEHVGEDNARHTPVMLHRAIVWPVARAAAKTSERWLSRTSSHGSRARRTRSSTAVFLTRKGDFHSSHAKQDRNASTGKSPPRKCAW